jgi:metal-responsive CopG/Arc/MetJ family transcriptional regulator
MDTKKLIPYSVYIPDDLYQKLKLLAKERKASVLIRDAISMALDGNDAYTSGYNKAIKDASKVVYDSPEAQMIAVKGKDLGSILTEQIESLEIKK